MEIDLLRPHSILESAAPELISQQAFAKVARHSIRICSRPHLRTGYLRHLSLVNLSLCNLSFGSETVVEASAPQDYYYIHCVLAGYMILEIQNKRVTVDSNTLVAINPLQKVNLLHSEDCGKLIIRIRRDYLERELMGILGYVLPKPIEFAATATANDPRLGKLIRTIDHVCKEVDDPYFSCGASNLTNHIEGLLATAVLTGLAHCYSDEIQRCSDGSGPSYLRRAERYIETHAAQPISLGDLVSTSGASMRTLYKAFNTYRNVTPMDYVKRVRLELARQELKNPRSANRTVADVAMAVGLGHLGNFAADYKRLYGELPSETLRRDRFISTTSTNLRCA